MKITICGSGSFRKEKVDVKKELLRLGHEPIIHEITEKIAAGEMPELLEQIKKEAGIVKKKFNFIEWYYNAISHSDAIIVVNPEKKGIKDYIGANTFLEMGYAHVLHKKIFILYARPDQPYIKDEIDAMDIIELHGNLEKIKDQ